jgi:hypothetical protein
MFASSFRLGLNIVVGPEKPRHIKTILSGHWPILIDYRPPLYGEKRDRDANRSAVWRMRAALRHRDRVREISIQGYGVIFRKFIKASNHHFPALESLVLCFRSDKDPPQIPATFLRGPDRPDLPLRRLKLYVGSIAAFFASGLLSSEKALTDLSLNVTTRNAPVFDPSQVSSLLACLQGMQCLRNLDLTIFYPYRYQDLLGQDSQDSQHLPVPKDTAPVSMSELTRFCYSGPTTFLNHFLSGLSAPSLQDVSFRFCTNFPLPYLSRVIDEVREGCRSVSVTFGMRTFHLLSLAHLGEIDHSKPSDSSFRFKVNCSPDSINSTKLAMAEELTLNFPCSRIRRWEDVFPMRDFLRQFRSVMVLRVNPFVPQGGRYLKHDDDGEEAILPALEKVKISAPRLRGCSDEEYQRRAAEVLAAFEPYERVGPPVKVSCCKQTEMQYRNARSW